RVAGVAADPLPLDRDLDPLARVVRHDRHDVLHRYPVELGHQFGGDDTRVPHRAVGGRVVEHDVAGNAEQAGVLAAYRRGDVDEARHQAAPPTVSSTMRLWSSGESTAIVW